MRVKLGLLGERWGGSGGGLRQFTTHCSGPSVLTSKYKPVRRDEGREGTNSNRNHTQMNGNGTREWGAAPTVIEIAQTASVQCKHALLQSYRFVLHHVRPTETPLHSPPHPVTLPLCTEVHSTLAHPTRPQKSIQQRTKEGTIESLPLSYRCPPTLATPPIPIVYVSSSSSRAYSSRAYQPSSPPFFPFRYN